MTVVQVHKTAFMWTVVCSNILLHHIQAPSAVFYSTLSFSCLKHDSKFIRTTFYEQTEICIHGHSSSVHIRMRSTGAKNQHASPELLRNNKYLVLALSDIFSESSAVHWVSSRQFLFLALKKMTLGKKKINVWSERRCQDSETGPHSVFGSWRRVSGGQRGRAYELHVDFSTKPA